MLKLLSAYDIPIYLKGRSLVICAQVKFQCIVINVVVVIIDH